MDEHVLSAADGPVGRITFNAPERLNAATTTMFDAVAQAVAGFDADPTIRVIALTGAGRGFCAGADIASPGGGVDTGTLYAAGRAARALQESATPTVALVGGVAAGAGVSLALACDYSLASASAVFTLAFAKIGLMPDAGATALVTAAVGRAKAMRMALTAEKVDGPTADAWGLVSECVAYEEYAARCDALLAQLAGSAPLAAAATKAAVNAAALDLDAALALEERDQAMLIASEDFAEGSAAFSAKRRPTFQGR